MFNLIAALVVAVVAVTSVPTWAAGKPATLPTPAPILKINTLLGQALPNECFNGIGVDYPPINADGTCSVGTPKTNESYIWGLTEQSGKLWFGTMANTACVIDGLGNGVPTLANGYVCEYGESEIARSHASIPPSLGDWRRPSIYSYDLTSGTLVKLKLQDGLLSNTLGIRGAGAINNIVFLAGQSLTDDSINIFAFQADTSQYLGSCTRTDYNYIRMWRVVDGVLYVGAGSKSHGAVLRWDGDQSSFPGNFCNNFTEVGTLTGNAANVTLYVDENGQDRLASTTVSITSSGDNSIVRERSGVSPAAQGLPPTNSAADKSGVGVWISPPLGTTGLTAASANGWQQVWSPQQYDPDPVVRQYGYSGGAVQLYQGWLYWGTIHLQNDAALNVEEKCAQSFCFGVPTNGAQLKALRNGVYRTASVWRGRNLEDPATREVQLLYGETQLPACCSSPKTFSMKPTGWTPLYGPSGFGNTANEYIWQMTVFDNRLFMGTFDASVFQGIPGVGADLWRFDSTDTAAINENYTGLGDPLNYGIRELWTLDDQSGVIAGMADPFNLAVGGGWELRLLKETPPPKKR